MKPDKDQTAEAADLRHRAEELYRAKEDATGLRRTEVGAQRLVHELEVHRIELEMQNAELRQARADEGKALEKYTYIYDFAPVGYFTLGRNGAISAVNLTGISLLGIGRTSLIGRRFGLFVAAEARLLFADFLGKVFAGQGKESCEVKLTTEGNSTRFVQIEAVADKSGMECHIAVIDTTERRRAEEVIERLNTDLAARAAELEAANLELEAFNYSVAHDLRQPLNVISSYCQVIKEQCGNNLDEQCRGYLLESYKGTLRMSRLIEALLNFSRMGHVEPRRDMIDLSAAAYEVVINLKLTEPERQVDFRIADGIAANADANLIRVVLNNLLDNAWKYTGMRKEAVIEVGVTDIDGVPVYFVRDNGAGFGKADADKLFVPFQRLPGAEEFKGFGIGLATVERIIRRHGGKIWAEGEPGEGATFYFTLSADGRNIWL